MRCTCLLLFAATSTTALQQPWPLWRALTPRLPGGRIDECLKNAAAVQVPSAAATGTAIKSLCFDTDAGGHVVAVVRATDGVDAARLASAIGAQTAKLSRPDAVEAATGFGVGCVPPVGVATPSSSTRPSRPCAAASSAVLATRRGSSSSATARSCCASRPESGRTSGARGAQTGPDVQSAGVRCHRQERDDRGPHRVQTPDGEEALLRDAVSDSGRPLAAARALASVPGRRPPGHLRRDAGPVPWRRRCGERDPAAPRRAGRRVRLRADVARPADGRRSIRRAVAPGPSAAPDRPPVCGRWDGPWLRRRRRPARGVQAVEASTDVPRDSARGQAPLRYGADRGAGRRYGSSPARPSSASMRSGSRTRRAIRRRRRCSSPRPRRASSSTSSRSLRTKEASRPPTRSSPRRWRTRCSSDSVWRPTSRGVDPC